MKRNATINLTDHLHPVFHRTFIVPTRYNIWYGGKDTGKSWGVAMILILKLIQWQDSDILVLRKFNKDHTGTTFQNYRKVITYINELTTPHNHYFLNNFKFTKFPSATITYLPTGSRILFAGMDDPARTAGLTTDDFTRIIRAIHYEEPIEVSDLKSISKVEQQILAGLNYEIVEDSALRLTPEQETKAKPEIHFTMNVWRIKTSWIWDRYKFMFDKFGYDTNKDELIEQLEEEGYLIQEDLDYMGGEGIRLVHSCYRLLEKMNILSKTKLKKHKNRKEFFWKEYEVVSLGMPQDEEGMPFLKYKDTLKRNMDLTNMLPLYGGLDVGQVSDDTVLEIAFVDGISRHDHTKLFFNGELICKDRDLKPQAKKIIDKLDELAESYPQIVNLGFKLFIHKSPDFKIREPLLDEIHARQYPAGVNHDLPDSGRVKDLSWIKIMWAPEPSKKENRIGKRVQKWKDGFAYEWIGISKSNPKLFDTILVTELDKSMNRIEDKRYYDAINAAEHPLNYLFKTIKINRKRKLVKGKLNKQELEAGKEDKKIEKK